MAFRVTRLSLSRPTYNRSVEHGRTPLTNFSARVTMVQQSRLSVAPRSQARFYTTETPFKPTIAQVSELRKRAQAAMNDCRDALVATKGDVDQAVSWLAEKGKGSRVKGDRVAAEGKLAVSVDEGNGLIVELNSETDFVGRGNDFQELADDVCTTVMTSTMDAVSGDLDIEALKALTYQESTIGEAISSLAFKTGEKLVFRQATKMQVKNGIVGGYSHYGKVASLVGVESSAPVPADVQGKLKEIVFKMAVNVVGNSPQYLTREEVPQEYIEQRRREHHDDKPFNPEKAFEEVVLMEQRVSGKRAKDLIADINKKHNTDFRAVPFIRKVLGEGVEKKQVDFAEEVAKQVGKFSK